MSSTSSTPNRRKIIERQRAANRARSNTDSELLLQQQLDHDPVDTSSFATALASTSRSRLYELFGLIEKEFDALQAENLALHARVDALSERLTDVGTLPEIVPIAGEVVAAKQQANRKSIQVGQKLKTALPGRLVYSFKVGGDNSRYRYVRHLEGHTDGVWHVATCNGSRPVLGSASADQTARIWSLETGACLLQYLGHCGSVNSISFSPLTSDVTDLMVVTASGDQSAHIWKASVSLPSSATVAVLPSSEDELDPSSDHEDADESDQTTVIRQPLLRLTGHNGVVIAADWLCGGDQILTASWDRTANIYDAERGEITNILAGHDQELNHCAAHSTHKLVVTASKDSTFRLWDFRDPIHSVAVFQGHADSVTSVVFSTSGDKVVSGSDDRTVKVWDLRNMRSALVTVRLDSAVNRLAVSKNYHLIAIPHDNRHIRIYDLQGVRLARLARANRRCHRRMVTCAAWADDHPVSNLITCGFDKQIICWKIATANTSKD